MQINQTVRSRYKAWRCFTSTKTIVFPFPSHFEPATICTKSRARFVNLMFARHQQYQNKSIALLNLYKSLSINRLKPRGTMEKPSTSTRFFREENPPQLLSITHHKAKIISIVFRSLPSGNDCAGIS